MICPKCGAAIPLAVPRCPRCSADLRATGGRSAGTTGPDPAKPAAQQPLAGGAPQPLAPGALLQGRYRVERALGRGSFGRVYLARDGADAGGREVAIKALHTDSCRSEAEEQEAIAWFRREVSQLLTLDHPRLPKVHGYWTDPSSPSTLYLAMDYFPGDTMDSVLAKSMGPLPWESVVRWGLVLCDAIGYLHCRTPPIVFRDLKLQNIILDERSGEPALIDFGIARPLVSGSGTAIGTWGYAPPEQVLGRAEPRSDVFALGATLHALLTGRDPEAEFARLQRMGHDLPAAVGLLFPPANSLNTTVPAALAGILARATAVNAADRYPTAAELGAALRQVLAGNAPAPATPPAVSTASPATVPLAPQLSGTAVQQTTVVGSAMAQATVAGQYAAAPATRPASPIQQTVHRPMSGRDIVAGGAALGLIASVLPWYSSTTVTGFATFTTSQNGWHQWGILAILSFIAGAVCGLSGVVDRFLATLAPDLRPGQGAARGVIAAGMVAVLSAGLYLSDIGEEVAGPAARSGASWGLWLGAAAAVAMVLGGVRMLREHEHR